MRKLVVAVIVGALGLYGYRHYRAEPDRASYASAPAFEADLVELPAAQAASETPAAPAEPSATGGNRRCDGRQYCSQMTSCDEATWHLEHCPDMKMDGDRDGVPCEQQWRPGR